MSEHYAAYLRDSGGEAQDLSVSQQETEIQRWAAHNGFIITLWFRDLARPGSSTVGRDGFQAMIDHFRAGAVELGVVIWKMSRFSRSIDDAQFYRADLRRRGYRIVSLADNIPDGPEGRFFEAALDWMNQRFLEDLSHDVKRGLHDLVRNYGAVPGTPPRGFRQEPVEIGARRDGKPHLVHRWVPDPEWIPRVRQAFLMRLAGSSLDEITRATHLYTRENSYATFFSNPLYKGELHYGGEVYPHYCTPAVEPELWDQVQAVSRQYANRSDLTHPRRLASRFLLSGLARCAACGSPLTGITRKKHESYYCTRARRHACQARPIPRKVLETAVLADLKDYILLPETLSACQAQLQANTAEQAGRAQVEKEARAARLAGIEKRIANLTQAIEDGGARALLERLKTLEAEQSALRAAPVETVLPAPDLTLEEIQARAGELQNLLSGENAQRLLRGFIEKISVEREGREIRGLITYWFPIDRAPPGDIITVPSYRSPVGAPDRRYGFSHAFHTQMRPYVRRPNP